MSKTTAFLCLVCLLLTAFWVILLIADMTTAGPLDTFSQWAAHASRLHGLYYATYLNAALLTLAVVSLFASLHNELRPAAPRRAIIGLLFVPIYGVLNLVAYLSQVTLVPMLISWREDPRYTDAVNMLLRLSLQAWPESAMAFFNGLAYALLGIPSIIFGMLLWRRSPALRWGGLLLMLNGMACILGLAGHLVGSPLLSRGLLIGGLLFLAAMFPLAWGFWRKEIDNKKKV